MPLSPEHVGRRYPATDPYVVSQAKIREFAHALGEDSEVYRGARPVAPPTFAIVIAAQAWDQMFHDPELGLSLERVVHGDQGFTWQRPLRVGDEVTAVLSISKVRTRGSADWIGSEVAVATTGGEPICQVSATFVHSHPTEQEQR